MFFLPFTQSGRARAEAMKGWAIGSLLALVRLATRLVFPNPYFIQRPEKDADLTPWIEFVQRTSNDMS
jgi:hypothetical protein